MDRETGTKPSNNAMVILALMVGAVTLSRIIDDEDLSGGVLDAAATEVRRIAGSDRPA